jgi:hypothetical protein
MGVQGDVTHLWGRSGDGKKGLSRGAPGHQPYAWRCSKVGTSIPYLCAGTIGGLETKFEGRGPGYVEELSEMFR